MARNARSGKCDASIPVIETKTEPENINTIVEQLDLVLPIIKEIRKKKEIALDK